MEISIRSEQNCRSPVVMLLHGNHVVETFKVDLHDGCSYLAKDSLRRPLSEPLLSIYDT